MIEHAASSDVLADQRGVEIDRLPSEQVLEANRANLADCHPPAERRDGWQDPERQPDTQASVDDLLDLCTRRRRNGDDQLVHRVHGNDRGKLLHASEYLHAVNVESHLLRVVVEEADRQVSEARVVVHIAERELARVPRTDDEYAAYRRVARLYTTPPLAKRAQREAHSTHEDRREHRVHDQHRPRVVQRESEEDEAGREQHAAHEHRLHQRDHVAHAHVSPPPRVQAIKRERTETEG